MKNKNKIVLTLNFNGHRVDTVINIKGDREYMLDAVFEVLDSIMRDIVSIETYDLTFAELDDDKKVAVDNILDTLK